MDKQFSINIVNTYFSEKNKKINVTFIDINDNRLRLSVESDNIYFIIVSINMCNEDIIKNIIANDIMYNKYIRSSPSITSTKDDDNYYIHEYTQLLKKIVL